MKLEKCIATEKENKCFIVYEVKPYKNADNGVEYDIEYKHEFKTLKELAKNFEIDYSEISKKNKKSKKNNKKLMFKKVYYGYRYPVYFEIVRDVYKNSEVN